MQFQGDLDQFEGENLVARGIAEAGREWSLTHWRREDMTAYMFRLYLEWVSPSCRLALLALHSAWCSLLTLSLGRYPRP